MLWLVVGSGSIGRRHISNLKKLGVEDIIAQDVMPERCREIEREFRIKTFDSLEKAFLQKPQVALICTPTGLHLQQAILAAQNSCHLFIEKPLAHSLNGVDQLLTLVRQNELITLVGCNMRFHPGIAKMKEILDKKSIGHVLGARVQSGSYLPDWHPYEDYRHSYSAKRELGGGVILDGIHEIDYLRWFLGEVEEVFCIAGRFSTLEIDTEDMAEILIRFGSGALAELHLDYVQRSYARSCQLIGDAGTVQWDFNDGQVRFYDAKSRGWQVFPLKADYDVNEMYVEEMKHFISCLKGEEKPMQDVFQAKRALEVALAAKDSAAKGSIISIRN